MEIKIKHQKGKTPKEGKNITEYTSKERPHSKPYTKGTLKLLGKSVKDMATRHISGVAEP